MKKVAASVGLVVIALFLTFAFSNCSGGFSKMTPISNLTSSSVAGVSAQLQESGTSVSVANFTSGGAPLALDSEAASRGAPVIGIHYNTWFGPTPNQDLRPAGSDGYCFDSPWNNPPLQLPGTKSLLFSQNAAGYCYRANDPNTANVHSTWLGYLGVDYVIIDTTNESKGMAPASDPSYVNGLVALNEFARAARPIRSIFMFSLTSWAQFECPVTNNCSTSLAPNDEVFTMNSNVLLHLEDLYQQFEKSGSGFVTIEGKPVVLIYLNGGSNVKDRTTNNAYFNGPEHLIPSASQMAFKIHRTSGQEISLSDAYSLRYALVAKNKDFRNLSSSIWMWDCPGCQFSEAGYATIVNPDSQVRDLGFYKSSVFQSASKKTLILSPWNSFSGSGDERGAASVTLEPNTTLYKVDTIRDDPYFIYKQVQSILQSSVARNIGARPSGLPQDASAVHQAPERSSHRQPIQTPDNVVSGRLYLKTFIRKSAWT